ncbi:MAG: hypothetical protein OEZ06_26650 [Myxococcales bacterium]|nr:hypothetical protein [Myxococcales bacterium]
MGAESSEAEAVASGELEQTPFAHLLLYLHRKGGDGTLLLHTDGGQEARVAVMEGRPIAGRFDPPRGANFIEALLPLCGARKGRFAFYEADLLGEDDAVLYGNIDPYAVLSASLADHARDDIVEGVVERYRGSALRIQPGRPIERLQLQAGDAVVVELLRAEPSTPEELVELSPLPVERTKRVLYALIVTHMVAPFDRAKHAEQRRSSPPPKRSPSGSLPGQATSPGGPHSSPPAARPSQAPASSTGATRRQHLHPSFSDVNEVAAASLPAWQRLASMRPGSSQTMPAAADPLRQPPAPRIGTQGKAQDDAPLDRAAELLRRGRHDEALAIADRLLADNSNDAHAHAWRARILFARHEGQSGLPRKVVDAVQTALDLDPQQPQALFIKGMICARAKDHVRAARYFKKVLMVDPKHLEAQRELRMAEMRANS